MLVLILKDYRIFCALVLQESLADAKVRHDSSVCMKAASEEIYSKSTM